MNHCEVLLVFADPVYAPAVQPYGLTVLAAALSDRHISNRIILPYMTAEPARAVKDACELFRPQVVGVSFRNLDTAMFHCEEDGERTFLDELVRIVNASRGRNSILALGGSGFAVAPRQILDLTGADVGFVGASENDFAEFCARVIRQRCGIGEAARRLPSCVLPGTEPPPPAAGFLGRPRKLDAAAVEYAKLTGGTIPVRTKTGCSMACSYCVVPNIERLILRDWDDLRDELKLIVESGLGDRVFMADGEFNLPSVERAVRICHHIRSEFGTAIKWTCYLEAGDVTPELLKAMREAGCVGVSLTVDSFSREARVGFIKKTPPRVAIEATQLCLDSGIRTQISLLFGGPNETLKTAIASAETAKGFNRQGADVALTIGIRVYPNTPLAAMVTRAKHAQYFRPGQRVKWLGMFCSPVPPRELATHILPILPPSPTVSYPKRMEDAEINYSHQIAQGALLLAEGAFDNARAHFARVSCDAPGRPEAELGALKAEYGLVHSLDRSRTS